MRLRPDGLSLRELDGETVLLDLATSTYLSVNRTGTELLRLLDRPRTDSELVESLLERFEVDRATATADVEAFLAALRAAGLLEDDPAP